MAEQFNGAAEPMRAIRDLISDCECGAFEKGNPDVLRRAQEGFTALRALHGDTRPAENIAFAAMREPDFVLIQLLAGALRAVAAGLPEREQHVIRFTGAYAHLGTPPISAILDMANTALEGAAHVSLPKAIMN
ncbi:hypothetical protein PMI42_07446 [Bradyrhizobium sp. YR681]|uniref:hypothetical protein n=1 Tax=Bradyrhizobium sp. YR681 TaxID=1144344 RepID=UPI00026F8F34|nr:hypothetical protein [Bradyrhizobium sp. YR681]EJN07916.1 hypothetical protein PMI42_07446 [Bradyrhizobium sp. YR681]